MGGRSLDPNRKRSIKRSIHALLFFPPFFLAGLTTASCTPSTCKQDVLVRMETALAKKNQKQLVDLLGGGEWNWMKAWPLKWLHIFLMIISRGHPKLVVLFPAQHVLNSSSGILLAHKYTDLFVYFKLFDETIFGRRRFQTTQKHQEVAEKAEIFGCGFLFG